MRHTKISLLRTFGVFATLALFVSAASLARGQSTKEDKPDYPPFEEISEGFTEIEPSSGDRGFYRLWYREKDNQLLAELPKDLSKQEHFVALTIASGDVFAGLQANDFLIQWRQYNKRLAMISPNFQIKSEGDQESKDSVRRLFTDRVLLDVPVLAIGPSGGPVVDMNEMLVKNATVFFGGSARTNRPQLARIVQHKVFSNNVEIAVEIPSTDDSFVTLYYSFSLLESDPSYEPRKADQRVGYFTTTYDDYGKYQADETRVRLINRWHLQKRDPSLRMSPPKQPIVFYLEHTTPVRYRRWVREGVLYWNKAFEQVGIVNAIEVYQQDKQTNAHMEKDPEDVNYNFIRWLNNNISTAIGPSRVNPRTGQILDADIVLTDGWIRAFERQFSETMPKIAMEGMSPETLAWLAEHPSWDPRVRFAEPSQRSAIRRELTESLQLPFAGHPLAMANTRLLGDEPFDGLYGRVSQVNGACFAAEGRSFDVAMMRMFVQMARDEAASGDADSSEDGDGEDDEQLLDGMPESFIGPLLADLVCHEVGHTIGLRHNFKASSIYSLEEMNSDKIKGKKPFAGSVMDYLPVNFNLDAGKVQGDWAMIAVGPYDMWAVEYGYTLDDDLDKVLQRVAEPELTYATDEDTYGPDPLARRYDFSKDPLDYAENQLRIAKHHRKKVVEEFVKDGDSWDKARRGYEMTLGLQTRATSMMANWLGGTFINRDLKGDKDARAPIEVVPAEAQRKALAFVIDNTFFDDAYGLTPDLLVHLANSHWRDERSFGLAGEPAWPVHDRILAIESSALTQLLNPTTLRQVYDNELRTPPDEEALTLYEMMGAVTEAVWEELEEVGEEEYTVREPLISSLRRSLQREHLERLIDLADELNPSSASLKQVANLAALTLRETQARIDATLESESLDAYSRAHLEEAADLIRKWRHDRNKA